MEEEVLTPEAPIEESSAVDCEGCEEEAVAPAEEVASEVE
jgi:hypothetical protein